MVDYLSKVWRGKESIGKTFWIFAIIGEIIVVIISDLTVIYAMRLSENFGIVSVLMRALHFSYAVFFFTAVWRSSERYEGSILWIILVRLVTIFLLIWAFYGFFVGVGWIFYGN